MKIDTTTIQGYAEMTAEQKLAALEALELPEADHTGYILKSTFDKTAKELSDLKKKHEAEMTEEERAKAAREAELETLKTENATLKREKLISTYTAKYLAQGFEEALAKDTAEALADGDTERVFKNGRAAQDAWEKKLRDEILRGTPRPGAGAAGGGVDYSKQLEEAQKNGDMAAVAYYTRLRAEGTKT